MAVEHMGMFQMNGTWQLFAQYLKEDDMSRTENYRSLSLLCSAYKMYANIIQQCISAISEMLLSEMQNELYTYSYTINRKVEGV